MKNPTMLYRYPGPVDCGGVMCETTIVDEDEVQAKLEEGWHGHFLDAKAAHDDAQAKLAENQAEQARIAQQLQAAGQPAGGDASDLIGDDEDADSVPPANAQGLSAVHKGRGKWSVVNADGAEVQTGLTKEQALAAAA